MKKMDIAGIIILSLNGGMWLQSYSHKCPEPTSHTFEEIPVQHRLAKEVGE